MAKISKAQKKAVKNAIKLAVRLGETPANLLTPSIFADETELVAETHENLVSTILGEEEMSELGMGLLLGVSQGSDEEARLIVLEYNGGVEGDAPIALVGKTLTFDSGGYSLKPSPNMHFMGMDMLGGGAVLATMQAIAELDLPINVVAVMPSSENLINGRATKPGDVHTAMDGTRVSILDTDAEGRLILADALTYVQDTFKPRAIIDVATLTGAAIYALGSYFTCVLGNDKKLAKAVVKAGKKAKDLAFHLPFHKDVFKEIKHDKENVADLKNIAGSPGPGTTTAAAFLSEFVDEETPWVHLDVAATASKGDDVTGRPVGLLVQFLVNESNLITNNSGDPAFDNLKRLS
jgi:leucyl aminopeptidase